MFAINLGKWRIKRKKFLKEYKNKVIDVENIDDICDYKESTNSIVEIVFYDVLDNTGFTKLIKNLYKFKKKKIYDVDTRYRKKIFKNLNYIYLQFDGSSTEYVGNFKFKEDNFVSEINIDATQINNEEKLICYTFHFKKMIWDSKQITKFVKENIMGLNKFKFTPIYNSVDELLAEDREISRINLKLFYFILQGYIVKYFYSEVGKIYQLPRLTRNLYYEHTKEIDDYLEEPFLKRTFKYDGKDNYFTVNTLERPAGIDITEYIFGKSWKRGNLLSIFSDFRMEAYLTFFYSIEVDLLQSKISKFLNSKRKSISSKDYKWLLCKLRRVEEEGLYEYNDNKHNNLSGYSKGCTNLFIGNNDNVKNFKNVYRNNLEYLSAIHVSNYNTAILIITIMTLVFTIFGLVY